MLYPASLLRLPISFSSWVMISQDGSWIPEWFCSSVLFCWSTSKSDTGPFCFCLSMLMYFPTAHFTMLGGWWFADIPFLIGENKTRAPVWQGKTGIESPGRWSKVWLGFLILILSGVAMASVIIEEVHKYDHDNSTFFSWYDKWSVLGTLVYVARYSIGGI